MRSTSEVVDREQEEPRRREQRELSRQLGKKQCERRHAFSRVRFGLSGNTPADTRDPPGRKVPSGAMHVITDGKRQGPSWANAPPGKGPNDPRAKQELVPASVLGRNRGGRTSRHNRTKREEMKQAPFRPDDHRRAGAPALSRSAGCIHSNKGWTSGHHRNSPRRDSECARAGPPPLAIDRLKIRGFER